MKRGQRIKINPIDDEITDQEVIEEIGRTLCRDYNTESCRNECATLNYCRVGTDAKILFHNLYQQTQKAYWIPNDMYYSPMNCYVVNGYTCSNCKTKVDDYTNYCSYCGAQMIIKGEDK